MLSKILSDLQVLGGKIEAALKADQKLRKSQRHAEYRRKCIEEATSLWDEYNKVLIQVTKLSTADDPCVKEITTKYADIYKEYTDRLLLIKDDDEQGPENDGSDQYEIQQGRLSALKRVMTEVELLKDHNEQPSSAFIAIKTKRISELWQRIEIEHEKLLIAKCKEPIGYSDEYNTCESLMDMSLMFLHENIQSTNNNSNSNDGLKLSRVEIQKFGGDYFRWVTFRDLFQSMVIENKKLSNSQRMQMLKTHVTGEAEALIKDLTISETNFAGAWKRLVNRYGNERMVVYKMINKLMAQQICKEEANSVKNLLDTTEQILLALQNLGRPVQHCDDLIVPMITKKLHENLQKDWEKEVGDTDELSTWEQLKTFLEKQFRIMERVEGGKKRAEHKNSAIKSYQSSVETKTCVICSQEHTLYKCPTWIEMSVPDRWAAAKRKKWCFLCLKIHPGKKKCDKKNPCKKCDRNHSTWLHKELVSTELAATHRAIATEKYDALLATALIKTTNINGQTITLRALVDSGSEGSMITEEAAKTLQLNKRQSNKWIAGLNGSKSGTLKKVTLTISPRFTSKFAMSTEVYILENLTKTLPNHNLCTKSWKHIRQLVWADPSFHKKGKIDALLGMDVIVEILKGGLIKGSHGQPMAQETELGCIMSGKIDPTYPVNEMKCFISTQEEDINDLQRFWELEEMHPARALSADELQCEQHYERTHHQAGDGKFVVNIPFKSDGMGPGRLGESRGQALARFLHLVKWRIYKIVIKADIEKMYRMIQLHDDDQKYHTFFWRASPQEKMREYQMKAVTFGTAAAPFLATRTLKQLALNIKDTYPLAAACLEEDFYVDDLVGGSHSVEKAIQCKNELMKSLGQCNFKLRKWASNNETVLESLPAELTERSLQVFTDKESTKALGIIWVPQSDTFKFSCNWAERDISKWSKREFLAEASKIFDPLGWLAPITINAKIMMQDIWQSRIGWDDQIPETVNEKWIHFRSELKHLESISINRWISYSPGCVVSIHGFGDASEKAYSSVIYARIEANDAVTTHLLASKTRVAPIKSKLTLPRLELCGALLTAALMDTVAKSFQINGTRQFLWTDSMITLGWINGETQRWKTFVANRVAEIQAYKINETRYVPSEQNPADCASRGIMPAELPHFKLWWEGPAWLRKEQSKWPNAEIINHDEERRGAIAVNIAQIVNNDTMESISSWHKLKRIAAYCRRFKTRVKGRLTASELFDVESKLIKRVQEESFSDEMSALSENKSISKQSTLKSLNIFLDQKGILRVGGRIENADLPFGTKHPMVLPADRHVTKLIIQQIHLDTLHGGPKLMRNLLMRKYWILHGKRMVQNTYKKCSSCQRFGAASYKQRMGELPKARVTFTRAFFETGVDYAGPVEVKTSKLRSSKIEKGYIAIFVCMSTKAVHLELVSDQTSEAFLATFKRFVARRGLPSRMHSDNGTTFLGAANRLEKDLIIRRNSEVAELMINENMEWSFIPEGSPNFGGLWERAVRSLKDHLKRTLKTSRLTFEEYTTMLCQTEACMNSRPLCALSNNIEDIDALTPGHFLVGTALLAPPESTPSDKPVHMLKRWQYVQTLQKQLWNRWSSEYLVELQQRHKWQESDKNAQVGELVVVRDEDLPPRNWLLGRIEILHPGKDGEVRAATIRIANNVATGNKITKPCLTEKQRQMWINTPTKTTTIKRTVRKLCPITFTDQDQSMVEKQKEMKLKQKPKNQIPKRVLRPRSTGLNMALTLLGMLMLCLTVGAESITNCITPQGVPIICQSKRPMNNMQSSRSRCERELLAKHVDFSRHCRINVTQSQDAWIQLKEKNMWIYGLHEKTTLNVVYSSEVDTITLQGSGIMEVSPGCEVIQHGFTMIGQAKMITKGSQDFQPAVNLSKFVKENPIELQLINGTVDQTKQFKEIYSLINATRNSSATVETTRNWHLGMNFVVITSLLSYVLWVNRKHFTKFNCRQNRNDVEVQHDSPLAILPTAAERSITTALNECSVDKPNVDPSSTVDRHGPGGCPFRT